MKPRREARPRRGSGVTNACWLAEGQHGESSTNLASQKKILSVIHLLSRMLEQTPREAPIMVVTADASGV